MSRPAEKAVNHKPRLAYVNTKTVSTVAVVMLLKNAGLSLLNTEGKSAKIKIHDPIENTISCQAIKSQLRSIFLLFISNPRNAAALIRRGTSAKPRLKVSFSKKLPFTGRRKSKESS